jgi:hypothetical protein
MLCLFNKARTDRGLQPVRWVNDPTVARKARLIVACDDWDHRPCGQLVTGGWRCEVIAAGYPSHRATFRAWMASAPHRRCVLSRARGFTASYRKRASYLWVVHLR